VNSRDFRF